MTIAVAQPRCVAYDVAANSEAHAKAVRASRARVVLFPELSLTGYELDAPVVSTDDSRLLPLIEACGQAGALALTGAPTRSAAGEAHISLLAVDGKGATVAYNKLNPGGAEPERFRPGREPAVLEVDGWRLGLAICKDTGVRQHAQDTAALGIDAYLAAVLESEEDAAIPDERAFRIATEYHVWVAVASFAGSTGGGYERAAGRSAIWSPDGRVVSRAGPEPGGIARATLA